MGSCSPVLLFIVSWMEPSAYKPCQSDVWGCSDKAVPIYNCRMGSGERAGVAVLVWAARSGSLTTGSSVLLLPATLFLGSPRMFLPHPCPFNCWKTLPSSSSVNPLRMLFAFGLFCTLRRAVVKFFRVLVAGAPSPWALKCCQGITWKLLASTEAPVGLQRLPWVYSTRLGAWRERVASGGHPYPSLLGIHQLLQRPLGSRILREVVGVWGVFCLLSGFLPISIREALQREQCFNTYPI